MNEQDIIHQFYSAFADLDAESMVAHYADDVTFEDPAFGILKGESAKNMWRMLVESQKGKDFIVRHGTIEKVGHTYTTLWEAEYAFSKTGRKVHNKIKAVITIENNKIVDHRDTFDLHRWAGMALGIKGRLLGGTSFFRKSLQKQTNTMLAKWEAKKAVTK